MLYATDHVLTNLAVLHVCLCVGDQRCLHLHIHWLCCLWLVVGLLVGRVRDKLTERIGHLWGQHSLRQERRGKEAEANTIGMK